MRQRPLLYGSTTSASAFNYGPDGAHGDHYATYLLDPHGFMLEVVGHREDEG